MNQAHAKLGRVEIAGAAAGTEVTIDGESGGTTPLAEPIFVEPGTHSVKMRGPDGSIDTESATATAGERVVVRFTHPAQATPAAAPPPAAAPVAPPAPAPESPPPPSEPQMTPHAPEGAVQPAPTKPESERPYEELSIAPFIVGGVVVVASAAVAIAMKVSKDSAQNKANSLAQQISAYESQNGIAPTRCTSSAQMSALPAKVVGACSTWSNNNTIVNEDATVGNIAIGVGVAALVGTAIYGIVYATHSRPAPKQATITPMVGPSFGGLSIHVDF